MSPATFAALRSSLQELARGFCLGILDLGYEQRLLSLVNGNVDQIQVVSPSRNEFAGRSAAA